MWGLTLCVTITLDGNLNGNTQPPLDTTHTHLIPSLEHICSVVAIVISKPITAPKPFCPQGEEAGEENCPSEICSVCTVRRLSSLLPHHTENLHLSPDTKPTLFSSHPPLTSGEDSIINQFTSCVRHPAEDGNEQWGILENIFSPPRWAGVRTEFISCAPGTGNVKVLSCLHALVDDEFETTGTRRIIDLITFDIRCQVAEHLLIHL